MMRLMLVMTVLAGFGCTKPRRVEEKFLAWDDARLHLAVLVGGDCILDRATRCVGTRGTYQVMTSRRGVVHIDVYVHDDNIEVIRNRFDAMLTPLVSPTFRLAVAARLQKPSDTSEHITIDGIDVETRLSLRGDSLADRWAGRPDSRKDGKYHAQLRIWWYHALAIWDG